jgi:hypothetical protein
MCYAIHLPRNDTRKKHVSEFIEPHSVYVSYMYIYIYVCIHIHTHIHIYIYLFI